MGMTPNRWRARRTLFLVAAAMLPGIAAAQLVQPTPASNPADPANSLSLHLRTLASAPRDLTALLGAGQSALDVGDPNAALGFFARADEIQPNNPRAKAGLAAALLQLEKPDDALRLFGEAVSLGTPEASIAADRGLAYDLRGDNRRAQQDYELALRRSPSDEVTRRYALSLGISGDKAKALTLLDPLLRRQDQGAWRARAFVLAMNDDLAGANMIARQVMPAGLGAGMAPFLSRLVRLNPAERAHAVNFGTVPADGQTFASVQLGDPYRPAGPSPAANADGGLIPSGKALGRQLATTGLPAAGRPAASAPASTGRVNTRVESRIAAVDRSAVPTLSGSTKATQLPASQLPLPTSLTQPAAPPNVPLPTPRAVEPTSAPVSARIGPPATEPPATEPAAVVARPAIVQAPPAQPVAAPRGSRLASILAGIVPETESAPVALPDAATVRAQQRAAARKAADAAAALKAEKLAREEKAKEAAAARANPARLWVQVATGSNQRGLSTTWARIRDANAAALKGYAGYSVAFKATNRILAGPVKTAADARKLVNALAKNGVAATTYGSEAGQEILKLASK